MFNWSYKWKYNSIR